MERAFASNALTVSPFIRSQAVTKGDRFVALSVFMVLLAAFTATFSGLPDNPDAEVEFQTTSALARNGTLALGGTPEAQAILEIRFSVRKGGPGREKKAAGRGEERERT